MLTIASRSLAEGAETDPSAAAMGLYRLATIDDDELRFASALQRYEAAIAASPSFRYAPRARSRADLLRQHAEGNFEPYATLERVRRDPKLANDAGELERLARTADSFPPGLVRVEARMLVATAYMGRLSRPDDAVELLQNIVADDHADPITARQARKLLVDRLLARRDFEGARIAAAPDPALTSVYRRHVRRRALHVVSLGAVIIFVALVGAAFVRRAKTAPLRPQLVPFLRIALPFAAWTALVGGALASSYEAGNAKPFLLFGLCLAPIALFARLWSATGSDRKPARLARAVVSAATVFGAAFLLLEHLDTAYLEGFGL